MLLEAFGVHSQAACDRLQAFGIAEGRVRSLTDLCTSKLRYFGNPGKMMSGCYACDISVKRLSLDHRQGA